MIRFARCPLLGGETGCAESFPVLDWCLAVEADDVVLAFGQSG
jgi:hypothetical protein